MKITNISVQARNPDRVNISIDGKYRFSLDIAQVVDLGIKQGQEIDDDQLALYEQESVFGKLYTRCLEYCFVRPRSEREVRDYLHKKTRTTKYRARDGQIKERCGVSQSVADRVLDRLKTKSHVDDEKFARWWVENRDQRKGTSLRKLRSELMAKGIDRQMIDMVLEQSTRSDSDELAKIIEKKRARYDDDKLTAYLARRGFSYSDIKTALETTEN